MNVKRLDIDILVDIPDSVEDNYHPDKMREWLEESILLLLDGITAPLDKGEMRMFMSTSWNKDED